MRLAQTSDHEQRVEEHTFAGLVAIVLVDLRQSRSVTKVNIKIHWPIHSHGHSPKVAHRTDVSQNQPTSSHTGIVVVLLRGRRPHASLPGNRPPSHTNNKDAKHADNVLDPSLASILTLLHNLSQRIFRLALAATGSLISAQRARRPAAAAVRSQDGVAEPSAE